MASDANLTNICLETSCTIIEETGISLVMGSQAEFHEDTHIGERPYKCQFCLKDFTYRRDLERHTRTHTGEKPFECRLCPKAFARPDRLKKHMQHHPIGNPNDCHASKLDRKSDNVNSSMAHHWSNIS